MDKKPEIKKPTDDQNGNELGNAVIRAEETKKDKEDDDEVKPASCPCPGGCED